jgi:hypothetical protein
MPAATPVASKPLLLPGPCRHRRPLGLHRRAQEPSRPAPSPPSPSSSRSSSTFIAVPRTTPQTLRPPPPPSPSPSPLCPGTTPSAQWSPLPGPRCLVISAAPENHAVLPAVTTAASTYSSSANPLPLSFPLPL